MRPWPEDEAAWARECAAAGDSFAEIAETAGRTVADVARIVGLKPMTERQRAVAQCLAAGLTLGATDAELGRDGARHVVRRLTANGYQVRTNTERLTIDEIWALARGEGYETLTALAVALKVAKGTSGHWRQRGLPRHRVEAVFHG